MPYFYLGLVSMVGALMLNQMKFVIKGKSLFIKETVNM